MLAAALMQTAIYYISSAGAGWDSTLIASHKKKFVPVTVRDIPVPAASLLLP